MLGLGVGADGSRSTAAWPIPLRPSSVITAIAVRVVADGPNQLDPAARTRGSYRDQAAGPVNLAVGVEPRPADDDDHSGETSAATTVHRARPLAQRPLDLAGVPDDRRPTAHLAGCCAQRGLEHVRCRRRPRRPAGTIELVVGQIEDDQPGERGGDLPGFSKRSGNTPTR